MNEFNRSIQYTRKLYKVDIRQSLAYSKALTRAGILTNEEAMEMERGLRAVEKEWDEGTVSMPVAVYLRALLSYITDSMRSPGMIS